jgi:hypothetical protein
MGEQYRACMDDNGMWGVEDLRGGLLYESSFTKQEAEYIAMRHSQDDNLNWDDIADDVANLVHPAPASEPANAAGEDDAVSEAEFDLGVSRMIPGLWRVNHNAKGVTSMELVSENPDQLAALQADNAALAEQIKDHMYTHGQQEMRIGELQDERDDLRKALSDVVNQKEWYYMAMSLYSINFSPDPEGHQRAMLALRRLLDGEARRASAPDATGGIE